MNDGDSLSGKQLMLAACSGSFLTSVFVTPFDVIKTRLQTMSGSQKCLAYCNCAVENICFEIYGDHKHAENCKLSPKSRINGTIEVMYKIVRLEGPRSLWSGLTPTLAMSAPATMIYYPTYEWMREKMYRKYKSDKVPAVAGALSRSLAVTIVSPIDLIRTKMQSKNIKTKELVENVRRSVRHEGFRSMYIGLIPTLWRDVPFSMIYWYSYERCRRELEVESLFFRSFISGTLSGSAAALITQPFDVIKTRRQIQIGGTNLFGKSAHNATLTGITRNIVRHSGLRGLFVGLTPRMLKVAPACAIMITSYEMSKSFIRNYQERDDRK